MKKNNKEVIFWVDNLGFCSIWPIWRSARNFQSYSIYYKKINFLAKSITKIILGRAYLKRLKYNESDIKTENGMCLYYKKNIDVIDIVEKVLSKIYQKNCFISYLTRLPQDKTMLYLKQSIALAIEETVSLSLVANYYSRNDKKIFDSINIIVSKSADILNLCLTEEEKTFRFIGYRSITSLYLQKSTLRILLEFLGQIVTTFISFIRDKKRSEDISRTLPKIGVSCTQKINLNERSVLFWIPHSPIKFNRVLVYFENSHRPVTGEVAKLLEEYGASWLALRRKATRLGKKNFWKLPRLNFPQLFIYIQDAYRITNCLLFRPGYLKLLQWYKLIEFLIQTYYYETFYRDINIKILWDMDNGLAPTIKAVAMDLVGGISLATHWSNYVELHLIVAKPYDIFFTWGRLHSSYFKRSLSCFQQAVHCGYIYDYKFPEAQVKSRELRQKLKDYGASYIIGFMDNAFSVDSPFSKDHVAKAYRSLLNLTIDDNRIGLILKPKRPNETFGQIEQIQNLLKEAFATGRCLAVEKNNLEYFTFEAGLACDLTIGFGVSTPTVENALAGIRSVDYDPAGNYDNIFYQKGYNKVVFNDLDLLIESIKKQLDTPEQNNSFANHSLILDEIDPFRDGKAAERIGFYMNELLMALDERLSKDIAIERANQRYQERYGYDKVEKFERQFDKFTA